MDSSIYHKYKEANRRQNYHTLLNIEKVCRRLQANQQVVATAMMVAHKHLFVENASADSDVVCAVSILLAFKINDMHQSLDNIIAEIDCEVGFTSCSREKKHTKTGRRSFSEAHNDVKARVLDQELLFCICTNFEFSYINYYDYLFTKLRDFELSSTICDIAHIILNDLFYLPLFIFYSRRSIVYSVLFLAIEIEIQRDAGETDAADNKITGIRSFLNSCMESDPAINVIISELLDFYGRFCE
eukprot:jgi/Antlo1/937/2453